MSTDTFWGRLEMSRSYKFHNKSGIYFISFATVYWIDIFIREIYFETIVESLKFCREQQGIKIYGYCIMPSHIHLLFQATNKNPSMVIRNFKSYTSKRLLKQIINNTQESRKEWVLWLFRNAGKQRSNISHYQFWQHNNHPIEIHSEYFFDQKLEYIHQNPVLSGFVSEAKHWKYSSAKNYYDELDCVLEIDKLS